MKGIQETNQRSENEIESAMGEIGGQELRHVIAELSLNSTVAGLALVPWPFP